MHGVSRTVVVYLVRCGTFDMLGIAQACLRDIGSCSQRSSQWQRALLLMSSVRRPGRTQLFHLGQVMEAVALFIDAHPVRHPTHL